MSRLTRDGTAEPVSRDQILRRERGQGNIHFFCSVDHEQDWQPYPVNPYSCYICVTIHCCYFDVKASHRDEICQLIQVHIIYYLVYTLKAYGAVFVCKSIRTDMTLLQPRSQL